MLKFLPNTFLALLGAAIVTAGVTAARQSTSTADPLKQGFVHPPDGARIMMRWWWFGPTVENSELARELRVMKSVLPSKTPNSRENCG
jgi:hypothetical protein